MRRLVATIAALGLALAAASVPAAADDSQVNSTKAVEFPIRELTFPALELRFPTATLDGSVSNFGNEFVLAADVFFAYNDHTLNAKAVAELAIVAERIRQDAPSKLIVTGHTDSDGSDASNQKLSQRRAASVKAHLGTLLPGIMIEAVGKGEIQPVADNSTPAGRAKNRRVNILYSG